MKRYFVGVLILAPVALGAAWWVGRHTNDAVATRDLLGRYCTDCHNSVDFTAELVIDPAKVEEIAAAPEHWEKIVRKLREESMPPDDPRPDRAAYLTAATYLEGALDEAAAAQPNPGEVPAFRRLTRTEYRNAVRDLLALDDLPSELDFELLLPADNAASGFDNIADLLFVSPVVMERYIAAAQKIARLAVGDLRSPVMVNIHQLSEQLPQDERVDGLPFGTRGGLAIPTFLPLDAEYTVDVEMANVVTEPHEIELNLDGGRVAATTVDAPPPGQRRGPELVTFRVPLTAGPHMIGITFVERSEALDEGITRGRMRGRGTLPAIAMATVRGPYQPTGAGDTPSRNRIFVCQPSGAADEPSCAEQILRTLARRAYRRPATDVDIADLMPFYEMGRAEGGFDAGIQFALERLLVSPQFLYRIEREPSEAGAFAVSDLELASRLSFFLWSSIPDDELLEAASSGSLRAPGVLSKQVQRMLADSRSESMVTNFAAQWLFLRDVAVKDPDIFLFPDHDVSLRAALERETELFVDSVLRGGGSVLELLTAKHTFVNERLAKHYRYTERPGQLLPPCGARRSQSPQRPLGAGQHTDRDFVRGTHVSRAARQVRARQSARFTAAAAAAGCPVACDGGCERWRAPELAGGDDPPPRGPRVRGLSRQDGPDRFRARALRRRRPLARRGRGGADRCQERAARRQRDRWAGGRAGPAHGAPGALRGRTHREAHDVCARAQRAVLRRAGRAGRGPGGGQPEL